MLCTEITRQLDIPGEPGETITIRKLSHLQLEQAAERARKGRVDVMREIGAELIKVLRDPEPATNGDSGESEEERAARTMARMKHIQEAQAADVMNYDRHVLLKQGIVSWSYDAELPKAINDLDEATAAWAADEVFRLSRPETEDARKNV